MFAMKKLILCLFVALLAAACGNTEKQLKERAAELCRYIPDHRLSEQSRDYMTGSFYAVLDTLFNLLPEFESMDHEWLHYFVTGNGGTIADYEVTDVEKTGPANAVATVLVRQKWEDGSFDTSSDVEEHRLFMEKVGDQWLMSDFDGRKADCIRHIAGNRREQAVRDAISDYLVKEIGADYLQGEICVPMLLMVAEETEDAGQARIWGDFWVFWYNLSGDTLQCVSGGNHAGLFSLKREGKAFAVASFEQTVDGAGLRRPSDAFAASSGRTSEKKEHCEISQCSAYPEPGSNRHRGEPTGV